MLIEISSFQKKIQKLLKNAFKVIFLKKPSFDLAETHFFLITEVCSLKQNHFQFWSTFLGFQPILGRCARTDPGQLLRPVYTV